ncbi:uncharacterized protein LOC133662365 [Entelurus aequoreus]|uniref:uncharacterized protein LOC133662365 n=1 Tax=Entelurus aequoreus TaxID=161455 RepID=UPI002B1D871C|nr:uncharacterized protein LOC133662365 [Entelurus aequoreus]
MWRGAWPAGLPRNGVCKDRPRRQRQEVWQQAFVMTASCLTADGGKKWRREAQCHQQPAAPPPRRGSIQGLQLAARLFSRDAKRTTPDDSVKELFTNPCNMGPCIVLLQHEVMVSGDWHNLRISSRVAMFPPFEACASGTPPATLILDTRPPPAACTYLRGDLVALLHQDMRSMSADSPITSGYETSNLSLPAQPACHLPVGGHNERRGESRLAGSQMSGGKLAALHVEGDV